MEAIVRNTGIRNVDVSTIPMNTRDAISRSTQKITDNKGDSNKGESVRKALKPVFLLARFLAIPEPKERFSWRNWKTMSNLFLITWGVFLGIMTILKVSHENFSYSSIGDITFYCLAAVYICLFLKLAMEWHDLMEEWLKMEDAMQGLPTVEAYRKISFVTVFIMCLALWEHLLCQWKEILRARQCSNDKFAENFYVVYFSMVFKHIGFSVWLGILLSIINFIMTIAWNFTDIFIICVCIALSARFEQLHKSLKRVIGQDMSVEFWRESRERYVKLSLLTKSIDERISLLLLLTFANNLYSICFMLYKSLKWHDVTSSHMFYYCTSFCLVTARLFGICLAAGRIHDLSKDILPVLFSVPSQSYNIEIHRLFLQIWQDPLSLTGSRFFSITRGLVLKIAGTIFTYEIVLAQFNDINTEAEKVKAEILCA